MFSFGGTGSRSASATTPPCATSSRSCAIPIAAAETGGSRGRTVRVSVDGGRVTSRAAGDTEVELYPKSLVKVAA